MNMVEYLLFLRGDKMALIANFTTGIGPDRPLNQPNQIFFPGTTNDGFAKTVPVAQVPFLQASVGTVAGLPVPYIRQPLYVQLQRVYSPSRRMIPRRI